MNSYEITFLVEKAKEAEIVKKLITSFEGKITEEKGWGPQTLAYEIEKKDSLEFFTWTFEMDTKHILEFKQKLNFDDTLVRYLILKHDEKKKKK